MATLAIIFKGQDEVSNASKQVAEDIGGVGKAADEAAPKGSGFFGGMLQAASGFLLANVVGAIGSQLGDLASSAIADARGTQQLMAQTETIIKNTGGAAGMSAQQVADLAASLSDAAGQSLFGDDQIQGAENVLLKYKELKGIIPGVTQLSVDMAQSLGKDPAAAAEFLGRALQKPFDAANKLAKEGIVLSDSQKATLEAFKKTGDVAGAQAFLMEQLNGTYAGSAKAAADAAGGSVQFQARMGEAAETVATALLPVIDKLGAILVEYLAPAIETAATWLGDNLPGAIDVVMAAIDSVIAVFSSAGESSDEFSGVLAFLGETWGQLSEIVDLAVELINATVVPIFKEIAAFLQAHSTEIKAILSAAWTIIKSTIDVTLTFIKGVIKAALQIIHGDWSGAWETIKEMSARIVSDIIDIFKAELEILKNLFSGVIKWLVDEWHALPGQLADVGKAVVDAIWQGIQDAWSGLVEKFNQKLQELRDKLPFSEPKDSSSPLHGLGKAGKAIVDMVQGGIDGAGGLQVGAPLIGSARVARGNVSGSVGNGATSSTAGGVAAGGVIRVVLDDGGRAWLKNFVKLEIDDRLTQSGNRALSRQRTGG